MMKTTLTALCVSVMATGAALAVSTDTSLALVNSSPKAVTFTAQTNVFNNGSMSSTVAAGQKEVHNLRKEVLPDNFALWVAASQRSACLLEEGTSWSDTHLIAEVGKDGTCVVSSATLIPGKNERQVPAGHKSNL